MIIRSIVLWLGIGASLLAATPQTPDAAPPSAPALAADLAKPQKMTFWFRMWPDFIVNFDPATDNVVAKIPTKNGVPHGMVLSHDKKRFFITSGQRTKIEVLDIASKQFVDEHDFKEDGFIVRIDTVREIPGGTRWYVKVNRIKLDVDRYLVAEPQWLDYSVADKEVLKRMKELPKEIRTGARISPDGRKWHVYGADLLVIDPETLKEEGKIELSKPLYGGMGPISLRGEDLNGGRDPLKSRMIYSMRDPVKKNRTIVGALELDLKTLSITNMKEWGADFRSRGLELNADGTLGVTSSGRSMAGRNASGGEQEMSFASYDLTNGSKLLEANVKLRTGLGLAALAPDGSKIYLAGRGHDLVVLNRQFQVEKVLDLDGEIDGRFYRVPE